MIARGDAEIEEHWLAAPVLALAVAGELDVSAAVGLRERVERALEAGVTSIVVDLSEVTFIDSVSLAVLVAAKRKLGPGGRLALVADSSSYVGLILAATKLDTVLDVFDDRAAAEAFAFASPA